MLHSIIILLFSCTFVNLQNNHLTDSNKVIHYHESFTKNINQDRNIAKSYLDSLGYLVNEKIPEADYYYHQDAGFYFFTAHNLKLSIENYNQALKLAKKLSDLKKEIDSKIWIANLDFFQGNIPEAKLLYSDILTLSVKIDYTEGIANGYYGLASIEANDQKAIELLINIDSLYTTQDTISPILANSYISIGERYLNVYKKKDIAVEYFKKSLSISQQTNYVFGVNHINLLLGKIALDENKYDEAYDYFEQLLNHSIYVKDTVNQYHNLMNLANVEIQLKKYSNAHQKIIDAIDYYKYINDTVSLSNAHLTMAELELHRKRPQYAKTHLDFAASHPNIFDSLNYKLRFLKNKVKYFEILNDYQQAFKTEKMHDSLEALLSEKRTEKNFLELEQKYRTNEKTHEIEILKAQNQLKDVQRLNQRNLFILGGSVLVFLSLGLFILLRNRQKTNERLRELDKFKSNFFTNISHEFRTPLTLISTPIQKKLSEDLTQKDKETFQQIKNHNDRLLELVDQLLDLSRLEAGKFQLHIDKGNILKLIHTLADTISYMVRIKKIDFLTNINLLENSENWFDKDIIQKITLNLLDNALKYTPEKGHIILNAFVKMDHLHLEVKNSGPGLSQGQLDKIFERFYQVNQNNIGSGIGLSLIRELIILHNGSIKAHSSPGKWTTFNVELPVHKSAFKKEQIRKNIQSINPYVSVHPRRDLDNADNFIDEDKPILLIVEDNLEVKTLIKNLFIDHYSVLTANNGEEGINTAIEYIPEIIISDIMMPITDGIELTRVLKKDERTSHIPIILLTSKSGDENILKGIEIGADEYITKPFNNEILITKVDKLIYSRRELRKRYSQEIILMPKEIAISDPEVRFLQKIQDIIDQKLVENSFSVDEFSKAVGISRMQLHRKIKALTGLTASEFIRAQRLKLAAELLKKSDINVSQVGYTVGFNDHSYFTKCFRETYGCTPSEYLKEKSS